MCSILMLTLAFSFQAANDSKQLELITTFRTEMIAITPGKGEFPAHAQLKQPFHIAAYEVPQNLWASVMGSNPSRWKGERNSVERLTFEDARTFCSKLTRLLREAKLINANQVVRLPYEDEWEYCAAADTKTAYSFGDDVGERLGSEEVRVRRIGDVSSRVE